MMNAETLIESWMMPVAATVLAVLLYLFGNAVLKRILERIRQTVAGSAPVLVRLLIPIRLLFVLITLAGIVYYVRIPGEIKELLTHILSISSIAGVSWFVLRIFAVIEEVIRQRYRDAGKSDIEARRITTNISLLRKIVNVLVVIVAIAGVLMTFETVRQIGLSILASAGLAGIVIGFAAQRSLQTLIAGIQIAITQPVRLGDIVVVEKESGRVEEITLTYVVVRLWDERRIIVPITWFIDKPFQNWTFNSLELTGAVMLRVGYHVPVDEVRREFERIVAQSSLWDKRIARLEVTDSGDVTMELRALVSAANATDLWNLRCHVREKLISFIHSPQTLEDDDNNAVELPVE
ncbi:mechanosensitive ion channel family protein [Chlorobaculum sp. MV4-Y]|uniref:mechanosensitive ion channel family protein n=1 Tax=Chlorobaculum sp. MV4-Y TaxID=2976335 RepID=UPI0021B0344C|nr:mechanosensitive ion channel family protein [Chlorobaculum sp. MV4-Y]UWX57308.1 mechanosensitive ion channel family protein [Chlorobaculum sp. MV4-Y]